MKALLTVELHQALLLVKSSVKFCCTVNLPISLKNMFYCFKLWDIDALSQLVAKCYSFRSICIAHGQVCQIGHCISLKSCYLSVYLAIYIITVKFLQNLCPNWFLFSSLVWLLVCCWFLLCNLSGKDSFFMILLLMFSWQSALDTLESKNSALEHALIKAQKETDDAIKKLRQVEEKWFQLQENVKRLLCVLISHNLCAFQKFCWLLFQLLFLWVYESLNSFLGKLLKTSNYWF